MDNTDMFDRLLEKFLLGECNEKELETFNALLLDPERGEERKSALKKVWDNTRITDKKFPVDWNRIYNSVQRLSFDFPSPARRGRIRDLHLWVAAASVIFIVSIAVIYFRSDRISATLSASVSETSKKNFEIIDLPDGSSVLLFAGSNLEYPESFEGATREVKLTGHAYFDISHHPGKPFIVHAGKLSTRVLGTAFYIRASPADESIEITVKRGKVEVLENSRSLGLITANQMIRFSNRTGKFVHRKAEHKPHAESAAREIRFDNITMEEAGVIVGEWFLVDVSFAKNNIKQCRVTATFSQKDKLEEVLTVICGVVSATYKIDMQTVIINGKGCNNEM